MRAVTKLLCLILVASALSEDANAQRRRGRGRGSVRRSRPDGTYNHTTRRGSDIQSTQRTEGNRRTTDTSVTGPGGESITGSREVTRDGDTLKLEGEAQSSRGGSREVSKEVEFDDGRIESVERESSATGRYGESIERESSAEREGNGTASFERKAETSTGREAEVDGLAGVGYYGRRGVVADVDTKYHGDWDVAARRGPYGTTVTRLPEGYRPYSYYGRRYYYYGSAYYRPYAWVGLMYYFVVAPPYGVVYTTVPTGAVVVTTGSTTVYYADHVCYEETNTGGEVSYEVIPAPEGLKTKDLPPERTTMTVDGIVYLYFKNTFYRQVANGQTTEYVVVTRPAGATVEAALPAEFEIVQASNGTAYFVYQDTYYLPYTDPSGEEVYIMVDPPAPAPVPAAATTAGTNTVERSLTVPAGAELRVRTAEDLSTDTVTVGQRFSAYLDGDVNVGQMLAIHKGSKVYGVVTEVDKAGSMSGQSKLVVTLSDIEVNGQVLPLEALPYAVAGTPESKDTGRKVVGGAGLGAAIGSIADGGDGAWKGAVIGAGVGTVASAASEGAPAVIAAQTKITFTLEKPVSVPMTVTVVAAE